MRTLIPASYYYDDEIFSRERRLLFNHVWHFVGLTDNLANHQDYVCTSIAGKSVVVMNFEGELRAFHNVCLHRFSRIIINEAGNGPLQCAYHGWTYNADGCPYGIPKRDSFSSLDLDKQKLATYKVETCGRFVFILLEETKLNLADYLGDAKKTLENYSEAIAEKLDHNELLIEANWKIVVENTLEDYHVRKVHPESLYKLGINERSHDYQNIHSSTNLKFNTKLESSKHLEAAYSGRPLKISDYHHQAIFPNLTIATAYGTTISIQKIMPVNSKQTKFISEVYATALNNEFEKKKTLINAFNGSAIEFNRKVFLEDKVICEQVQKGLEESDNEYGFLCQDEQRVYAFQNAYMNILNNDYEE